MVRCASRPNGWPTLLLRKEIKLHLGYACTVAVRGIFKVKNALVKWRMHHLQSFY